MSTTSLFIASTGQNIGKTTLSLGLVQGLSKRFSSIGFFKPVGQQYITLATGDILDKDAALFLSHFHLQDTPHDLNPVICQHGFTKRVLDDAVHTADLEQDILNTYATLQRQHDFMVVEGSGHMGVGSIFSLNNARIASLLKTPVVIVAIGGLGSSFDELALNLALAKDHDVNIRGIILNKVMPEKKPMIESYFPKALEKYGIPLLGIIPYVKLLGLPTINDFSLLFQTSLLSGKNEAPHHIQSMRLVACSLESFLQEHQHSELIITPSCRDDVIAACIERKMREQFLENRSFFTSLILTSRQPPHEELIHKLDTANIPALWVPMRTFEVIKEIATFTAKIQENDKEKIQQAIDLVEQYIDFDLLLKE